MLKIRLNSEHDRERIRLRMGFGGYAEFLPIDNPNFGVDDLVPGLRERISLETFLARHRSAFRHTSKNMRKCCSCGKTLPRSGFYRSTGNSDGLYRRCKLCVRDARRRLYLDNRKQCRRCHRILPRDRDNFRPDGRNPDGFDETCKSCQRDLGRAEGAG